MLVAKEHSTCMWRFCCGILRKLTMNVNLMSGEELLRIERPFRWRRGGIFCCAVDCKVLTFLNNIDRLLPSGQGVCWTKHSQSRKVFGICQRRLFLLCSCLLNFQRQRPTCVQNCWQLVRIIIVCLRFTAVDSSTTL